MTNNQFPITNLQTKNHRLKTLKIFCLVITACILIIDFSLFAQDTNPERIISLGPAITRQLYLLGVEDRIVGITTYCNIPQLEDRKKIGTVMEADLEKIVMLNPYLVIATALTNPKTIQKLKNLDVRVIVLDEVKDFSRLREQFLNLARLVNREQIGQKIILTVDEKMANLQKKVKNLSKPKVIVQIGANPLFTADRASFINDLIECSGGINIASDAKTGIYSREEVIKRNHFN